MCGRRLSENSERQFNFGLKPTFTLALPTNLDFNGTQPCQCTGFICIVSGNNRPHPDLLPRGEGTAIVCISFCGCTSCESSRGCLVVQGLNVRVNWEKSLPPKRMRNGFRCSHESRVRIVETVSMRSMHDDSRGGHGNNGGDNGIMMPSLIDNTATGGEKNEHTSR